MGDRLHGVEVEKRATKDGPGNRRAGEVLIRRICVRYEDGGKMCFVPEAWEEFFSQDDAHRVVGMLRAGANALEWGIAPETDPAGEPYGSGAV